MITLTSRLTAIQTVAAPLASDNEVQINGLDESLTFVSTLTTEYKTIATRLVVSGTTDTLDLTNLPDLNGARFNATGATILAAKFKLPSADVGGVLIHAGESNGFLLMDDSLWEIVLVKKQSVLLNLADQNSHSVSSLNKTIDIESSNAGDILDIELVFIIPHAVP